MSLPLRGVAVYNPTLLSKEELLAQFVARKALLETILEELRAQDRPDHRILIGPRGMGKTTLLRRIYFAVEEEPALAQRWIALPFPEEQYNLTRLSDFYLNCIDALGDSLVHLGRHAEAEALDRKRDALPDGDEDERAEAACGLLLSMADKLGRKLLLLVDNVEMVLDRLTSSQWKLRELLGHDPRLCLIGASAFAPEATYTYRSAFYEFFRFHELRPLQEEEAREVLLHLARVRRAAGVERVVSEEPARVRTLFDLAGGNPRTLVQLYAILAQSTEGDARSDLERLLDECTPIYKARFEALSTQAQQIVDAVALHWHPATAADIAAATRLDVNVVSSQVSRLLKDGAIEAVPAVEGSRKAYQVTERFFNIWYLMRASRRQRQRLVWLVELLRLVYRQETRPRRAGKGRPEVSLGDACSLARTALDEPSPEHLESIWDDLFGFFSEAVHARGAAKALQLLEELGLAERWLPLHAALAAARDGERALFGFAPEVRRPARALLARILDGEVRSSSAAERAPSKAAETPARSNQEAGRQNRIRSVGERPARRRKTERKARRAHERSSR